MTDPMELVGRLEAAVTAMQRRADDGWKMIPSGPSGDMVEALERCESYCDSCHGTAFSGWAGYEAMFKAAPDAILTLSLLTEAAACIREMVEWREGMVLVPRVPTDAMLQGACKSHIPGQSMGTIRGFEHGECPSFERRRRIWADMVTAALPPAPGAEA